MSEYRTKKTAQAAFIWRLTGLEPEDVIDEQGTTWFVFPDRAITERIANEYIASAEHDFFNRYLQLVAIAKTNNKNSYDAR